MRISVAGVKYGNLFSFRCLKIGLVKVLELPDVVKERLVHRDRYVKIFIYLFIILQDHLTPHLQEQESFSPECLKV